MSFYRTYRPQSIDEIDNLAVRAALSRMLSKPRRDLPHAFFLSGPRGAGKTTAARVLAKIFNCQKPTPVGSCGVCEQCISIAEGRNLDVLEIDAASNRGIDEIRALRDAISLSPISAAFRVYIIDEVHMLTTEAFNALLKTLEEPPAHAVFILATTDPQKVPVTILSRATPIVFSKASVEEIESALKRIIEKEHISIDAAAVRTIARRVDGSFRDAVKNLEQVSFSEGNISEDTVHTVLSLSSDESVTGFIAALRAKDAVKSLTAIESLVSRGTDIRTFISECLRVLETELVQSVKAPSSIPGGSGDLTDIIRKLSQAYTEMKLTAIVQLPLELAVVEFCEGISVAQGQSPLRKQDVAHPGTASSAGPGDESGVRRPPVHAVTAESAAVGNQDAGSADAPVSVGSLTVEKLLEHWPDIIAELKGHNHSIAGVMRSTRPKAVSGGIVTIEAFFTFHREKLSESKTKDILVSVFKKLFGEKVKVEIVLGKK